LLIVKDISNKNYRKKIEKIQKHAGLKNTNIEQMKNFIGKILQENIDEDNDLNKDQKQIGWKRILQAKAARSYQKWIQTQLNRIISQKATENLIFDIIE
jgi:formyltetrahydrofolate synthetase